MVDNWRLPDAWRLLLNSLFVSLLHKIYQWMEPSLDLISNVQTWEHCEVIYDCAAEQRISRSELFCPKRRQFSHLWSNGLLVSLGNKALVFRDRSPTGHWNCWMNCWMWFWSSHSMNCLIISENSEWISIWKQSIAYHRYLKLVLSKNL